MATSMWFAISVPKKEYELRKARCTPEKETIDTSHSSHESLPKKSDEDRLASHKDSLDKKFNGSVITEDSREGKVEKNNSHMSKNHGDRQYNEPVDPRTVNDYGDMIYFVGKRGPMEEVLREILLDQGVRDAVWCQDRNENFYQVFFPCEDGFRCDKILRVLLASGIGLVAESTVGVLPCMVFYQDSEFGRRLSKLKETDLEHSDQPITRKGKSEKKTAFKSMQKQFLKSITARLTVAQVVESVRAGTQLTFDFVMFVALASMIAALGLMENSSVAIVASMLISPLMGPILAGTFGAVIRDKALLMIGLKAEAVGLITCIVIGFLIGLVCGNFAHGWGPLDFPTPEMAARGQDRSLWVGVLIALPSGAGVALSVLGGNSGSLVGVAISASLLPPAVNAGLLWGLAVIKKIHSLSAEKVWVNVKGVNERDVFMNEALVPPESYTPAYRMNMDEECAILGVVSLLLTIVNIICIVLSAMIVLKIKEVAPHTSIPNTSRFWKQDIKIARDYNKTVGRADSSQLGESCLREWAKLNNLDPEEVLNSSGQGRITQYQTLQDILQDVEDDDVYQTVMRSVTGNNPQNMRKRFTMAGQPPEYQRINRTNQSVDIESGGDILLSPLKWLSPRKKQGQSVYAEKWAEDVRRPHTATGDQLGINDEYAGVQLRHRPRSASPISVLSMSSASSLMRRSWQQGSSPYSLWPTQNNFRRMTNRFLVTPVDEPLPPLPPRYTQSRIYSQVESNI